MFPTAVHSAPASTNTKSRFRLVAGFFIFTLLAGCYYGGSSSDENNENLLRQKRRLDGENGNSSNNNNNNNSHKNDSNAKRLVFFLGPRKAGTTLVEKFFEFHASVTEEHPSGLNGWVWPNYAEYQNDTRWDGSPLFPEDQESEKIFNLLLYEKSGKLQNTIRRGISHAWNQSTHGVLIASSDFDFIDESYPIMKEIQELVQARHVTLVMNYRTPRFDQWVSLFKHNIHDTNEYYKHFMCVQEFSWNRWSMVDMSMNPLGVFDRALERHAQDDKTHQQNNEYDKMSHWDAVLIDAGGANNKKIDLSHAIMCDVLQASCEYDSFTTDFPEDHNENHAFGGLNSTEQDQLEALFRERDCHYQRKLLLEPEDYAGIDHFSILYQDTLWEHCSTKEEDQQIYEQLSNSSFFLNALQTQKGCGSSDIYDKDDISGLLVGAGSGQD